MTLVLVLVLVLVNHFTSNLQPFLSFPSGLYMPFSVVCKINANLMPRVANIDRSFNGRWFRKLASFSVCVHTLRLVIADP